jgi:hypothetical protein
MTGEQNCPDRQHDDRHEHSHLDNLQVHVLVELANPAALT